MEQTTRIPVDNDQTIKTTCAYCGVGCGINAHLNKDKTLATVSGDEVHPANFGKLCSKGSALDQTLRNQSTRLLTPEIKGQPVSWDEAIDFVGSGLTDIIQKYGKESVAIYGSGQLLTEDYYVANKLMKGFIGTANMDTNSRLCMSSAVAAYKRAFGTDTVPNCYEDLEKANLIVIVGSNTAWCHPVVFQRIRDSKKNNKELKVVVIDPRKTDTCDIADLHLPLLPGSDVILFNALLKYLNANNGLDADFIEAHTQGLNEALLSEPAFDDLQALSKACGLDEAALKTFFEWFAETEKTVTLYSQGINQSSQGTDKANSIINCHLATGRVGKVGSGPFSITGQPNAMGGREVGGLSNQLASHLELANPDDRALLGRFWGSDTIADKPGYSAVDLFNAVHDGKVKAVWIMATNPVVSLPNADYVKAALKRCELVIVSDCVSQTDTSALAHVKLPAAGWGERDGIVTNSERRISHQKAILPLSGDAKPDWWIITQVARKMGFEKAFPYQHQVEIFREHAALSGFENTAEQRLRDFDISAYADIGLEDYENFTPIQWPVNSEFPEGKARFFADGFFYTPNNKANFVKTDYSPPKNKVSDDYPLILNTGRVRDQWHTMTRTTLSKRLNLHKPEPFIDINPLDAETYHIVNGSIAHLKTQWGDMLARVNLTDGQNQGSVFVPMHWTEQFASKGRVGPLVNPVLDPISFQPESKHTPVSIKAYEARWHGFVLTREPSILPDIDYQVKIPYESFDRYELADTGEFNIDQWKDNVYAVLKDKSLSLQEYADATQGVHRIACFAADKLAMVIFIAPSHGDDVLPERDYLCGLMEKNALSSRERIGLLSGKPNDAALDAGKIICSCFQVGEKTISKAIKDNQLQTPQQVGAACKAGTNCGSCIPEIRKIILQS